MNDANVFPLHGIDCHDCGQPASWYCDGVTLPCQCGAIDKHHAQEAVYAARRWRRPTTRSQVATRKREHVRSRAEHEAWIDLLKLLGGLAGVAEQGKVSR